MFIIKKMISLLYGIVSLLCGIMDTCFLSLPFNTETFCRQNIFSEP